MAIHKKLNQQTVARLLLESDEPVELPPAEVEDKAVIVQFDAYKPFIPELLETLRAGTLAEPVPMMTDDSSFAVHTATRTFWVKLWHASPERTRIERVQVISCLPLQRGKEIIISGSDDFDDDFAEETEDFDEIEEASESSDVDQKS